MSSAALQLLTQVLATGSKVGIGVYTDTALSPPLSLQLNGAVDLVGADGWVIVYLCSWRSGASSCMNATTTSDPASSATLTAAYARGLNVVARIGNPYIVRDHADDVGAPQLHFTALASAYARLIASLPPPPSGKSLYVHVGNEFNACNEWRCAADPSNPHANLSTSAMAAEVGAFYRDVGAAMLPLRQSRKYLKYAVGPISDWDTTPCACGSATPLGKGQSGLKWLQLMAAAEPSIYDSCRDSASTATIDWFASHSYPYQAPWGPKALRGLTYYRNETQTVGLPPTFPVLICETGWRLDPVYANITSVERANWTVRAFEEVWNRDEQVVAALPFLMAGSLWQAMGWSWANVSGVNASGPLVHLPVYTAVKAMRERNEQMHRLLSETKSTSATLPLSIVSWNTHWQCGSDYIKGCRANATGVLIALAKQFDADVVVSIEIEASSSTPVALTSASSAPTIPPTLPAAKSANAATGWTQINGSCPGLNGATGDAMALLINHRRFHVAQSKSPTVISSGGGCLGGDAGGVYKADARAFAVALLTPSTPIAGCPHGVCFIGLHAPHINITDPTGIATVARVCELSNPGAMKCIIGVGDFNAPISKQPFCDYTVADRWEQLLSGGSVESTITAAGPDAMSCCYPQSKYMGWDDHVATSVVGASVTSAQLLGYEMKQGDTEEHMPIAVTLALPTV